MGRHIADALVTLGQASCAVNPRALPDCPTAGGTHDFAWDPHDVWLRRIKQPRENAARAAGKVAA